MTKLKLKSPFVIDKYNLYFKFNFLDILYFNSSLSCIIHYLFVTIRVFVRTVQFNSIIFCTSLDTCPRRVIDILGFQNLLILDFCFSLLTRINSLVFTFGWGCVLQWFNWWFRIINDLLYCEYIDLNVRFKRKKTPI